MGTYQPELACREEGAETLTVRMAVVKCLIVVLLAVLVVLQDAEAFDARTLIKAIVAGLVAWRGFLDQSMSKLRQNGGR